jgi:hypothetical protein
VIVIATGRRALRDLWPQSSRKCDAGETSQREEFPETFRNLLIAESASDDDRHCSFRGRELLQSTVVRALTHLP